MLTHCWLEVKHGQVLHRYQEQRHISQIPPSTDPSPIAERKMRRRGLVVWLGIPLRLEFLSLGIDSGTSRKPSERLDDEHTFRDAMTVDFVFLGT